MIRGSIALPLLTLVVALGVARPAVAQVPTVDPGGGSEPAAAPAPSYAAPTTTAPSPGATGEAVDTGYYHTDDYAEEVDTEPVAQTGGGVPDVHTVRKGDTLWDLCWFYFNSPWEWPKVWSYNPEITNPHWIYPGDQVRLHKAGSAPVAVVAEPGEPGDGAVPVALRPGGDGRFELRQVAFVDLEDLKFAAKIDGSPEEKVMLATGDEAYLSYPAGKPPTVGKRYSIYQKKHDVKHTDGDRKVGAYVRVIGELEVVSVKKDKRARAVITDSVDVIERGSLVGPLKQSFARLEPTAATVDLQGVIVGVLGSDSIIGARQVVFLDKGKAEGVAVGNRMYAVRRGDAYRLVMGPNTNVGNDDRRFPARAIGEVMVVEVSKHSALAVVTMSVQELGIGDHVVLSRAAD